MINRGDIKLAIDMVVNAQDDELFGGEAEYVINTLEDCGNEIVSQRKQIEALTAQVGVLQEALVISVPMAFAAAIQNMEIEDEDAEEIYAIGSALVEEIPDDDRTVKETLFFLTSALATAPESALSEVRKAERERVARFVDDNCTYGDTHILVKAIRAMGDE